MCDLFPCILCCPSGALDPKVQTIDDVQMGTARVKSEQKCWAKTGKTVTGSWLKHLAQRDYLTELEQKLNAKMKHDDLVALLHKYFGDSIEIETGTVTKDHPRFDFFL